MFQELYENYSNEKKRMVKKYIMKLFEDYNKFYELKNDGIIKQKNVLDVIQLRK